MAVTDRLSLFANEVIVKPTFQAEYGNVKNVPQATAGSDLDEE